MAKVHMDIDGKRQQRGTGARRAVALLVAGLALAGPAGASADAGHPGCRAYGQFVAGAARGTGIGDLVAPVATSGPGALAALAQSLRDSSCGQ
jgi:hypothetical protein